MAAHTGNNAEISKLVSSGIDVDTFTDTPLERNDGPRTPLQIAFESRRVSSVLLLLDLGADPRTPVPCFRNIRYADGEHTVHLSSFVHTFLGDCTGGGEYCNHIDRLRILKKLKQRGIYMHGANFSACLGAERFDHGSDNLLEYYLEEGANPD